MSTAGPRILVIDDNAAIHEDFRKIFAGARQAGAASPAEIALFGAETARDPGPDFRMESALQGQEGLALVKCALEASDPYSVAFIDVRMPPGWDGVETTARIWQHDLHIQVVLCTAYSDYSWRDLLAKLGRSDRLVILKKPFDTIEVLQLASALTEKWRLSGLAHAAHEDLELRVAERTAELLEASARMRQDEIAIKRLNRVYAVMSGINALIVRARDREELLRESCRIAIESGEFRMALIALVQGDAPALRAVPVASAGKDDELLASIREALSSSELSALTMVGQAIRDKLAVVANDSRSDPRVMFRAKYAASGVRSLAVLPLLVAGEVVGILALYASESNFFNVGEMKLLSGLAADIALAIDNLRKGERLHHLAYHDANTGLANRQLLQERITFLMRGAGGHAHRLALFVFDLERFKNINDTLGRAAGDTLLRAVAQWLVHAFGAAGLVAHLGADHFAVAVPELWQDGDVARALEKAMADFIDHPFQLGDSVLRISARVGIALYPDDGSDAETLLTHAEAAAKKAKVGGARYLFYAEAMSNAVAGKLTLENQLRAGLERGEFVLHYKPRFHLASGKVVGAEASLWWNDPRDGLVPPGSFIPLMEETGLIHEAGQWMLEQVKADCVFWHGAGVAVPRIALSVSPLQLRSRGFLEQIEQAIGIDACAASGLELKITETLIMEDVQRSIALLRSIRALGITVAIDDFGSGYSSLRHLSKLPANALRIGRSFISGMTTGPEGLALVSTIIKLAHSLKLKVVAEGVETEEQSQLLRLLSCDEVLGGLFGKPLPRAGFEAQYLGPAAPVTGSLHMLPAVDRDVRAGEERGLVRGQVGA